MHLLRVKSLLPALMEHAILACELFILITIVLRVVIELLFKLFAGEKAKFLQQTDAQKWFYTTFYSSILYSQWLFYIGV